MNSLQFVCSAFIRDNVNAILEYFHNKNADGRILFKGLPPSLCEMLITSCSSSFDLRTFAYLFRSGIKEVNLSSHNQPLPIRAMEKIFKEIVYMRFSFSIIAAEHLCKLTDCLKNVVILNLRGTQTNDEVLEVIGRTCFKLEKLDISSCPITDVGIRYLCHQPFNIQNIRCQHLKILDVHRTAITSEGLAYLLEYLPLIEIYADRYIELNVIYCFVKRNFGKLLTVRNICLAPSSQMPDVLDVLLCVPGITSLCLYKVSISDIDIVSLPRFNSLQSFSVTINKNDRILTFEGIVGFLSISGNHLKTVKLNNLEYVNLFSIGRFCRKLRYFYLYSIRHLHFRRIQSEDNHTILFDQLEFMQIENLRGNAWEDCYSSYFLHCPELKMLTLASVTNSVVMRMTPFLKTVDCMILLYINDLTTCSIFHIIQKMPHLRNLFVFSGENIISQKEVRQILDHIRDNNISLRFGYWPNENINAAVPHEMYSVSLDELMFH